MVTDPNFLLYPDLYYFTYEYGNGDSYSGYGYAASGTYYIGQVLDNYSNETGNYGSYTINSVQTTYDGYGIEGEVYVTSYYNGETDYLASWDYDDINAYSNLGLGYEYGYFYSDYFSNYDEADLVITNATTLTLPSIFVSPKGGDIVGEGETQVFEIKLSNPYDQQILIQYKVKDWTASTDFYYGDFDGFSASFLTFDPGELVKEVYISIKDDLTDEDEEKYIFELYSASEGTYLLIPEEIQVVGRITDNDDSPSSLNITSLNPLGTPENPIIIPVDNSDITWIDIDFSYDNQSNEFIWIFSDGTGSTYSLGSSTYDTDNNDETNLGLLPKSGFNQQRISRGEPGEITAVSLFMQQQLVNGGYGNVLKEVTLPVNYIFVDDIDLAVTKLPIMNSLAEAGEEFTYTITISNDYSFYPGKIFLTEILPKGVIFVNSDIGPVYLEKDGDKTHLTFAFDNYSLSGSLIGTITVIPSKESRPIDNDFSQSGWTIETETHLRSGEIYINDPDLSNNSIIQEIQVFDPDFINDDTTSLPSITLSVSPASVLENGTSNLVYTFTRTGATTNTLTVNYSVAGTADNTDYTGTTTGTGKTVTFAAGSATAIVTIDPTADTTVENDETVVLTLVNGTGYTIATTSAVTGTITNDDVALPSISLAVSPASVQENSTSNLVYTFTRTGTTTSTLTANYTVGGTTTLGTDYTGISSSGTTKTVTFAAGSSTAIVTVDPTADTTVEPDETIALTLASGTGYTIATTSAVTGTIANDDVAALPSISLALSPVSVQENGTSNLVYTFTRTGNTTGELTVNFAVGGTAISADDYRANLVGVGQFTLTTTNGVATGTVKFAAGNSTITIALDPTGDTTVEPSETVALTLATGTGYTIATTSAVTGTIANDDGVSTNVQQITSQNNLLTSPGGQITVPLFYNTSTGDNTLGGIGLRLHYDSSDLTFQTTTNLFNTNLFGTVTDLADTNNFDGDPTTNRYLQVQYVDFTGNWPNRTLPLKLGDFSFTASNSFENTQLRVTSPDGTLAPGYGLEANPIVVGKREWTLDIDGDGSVGALSDGIMAVRYLFGAAFTGNALINGAISPGATRSLTEIQNYLQDGVDQKFLDIDGDGSVGALSDGIMAVRYLFGAAFAGNALINGAIAPDATRDLAGIQNYLADLTTIV